MLCRGEDAGGPVGADAGDSPRRAQDEGPVDLAADISRQLAAPVDDPSILRAGEVLVYAARHPEARLELAHLLVRSVERVVARLLDR